MRDKRKITYLLPWAPCRFTEEGFARKRLNGREHHRYIYKKNDDWYIAFPTSLSELKPYKTLKEAIKVADKMNLKLGYEFISNERAEKLKLLL